MMTSFSRAFAGLLVCMSIMLMHVISAQQVFQKSGDAYNAKVTIQRSRDYQPRFARPPQLRPEDQHWVQGDRLTKQEVIQNLARALLSRKLTAGEKRDEKRVDNARKLEEYTLQQARRAKIERGMRP